MLCFAKLRSGRIGILGCLMSEKEATTPDLVEPKNGLTDARSCRDLDAIRARLAGERG